jgi:hypothetical protein
LSDTKHFYYTCTLSYIANCTHSEIWEREGRGEREDGEMSGKNMLMMFNS